MYALLALALMPVLATSGQPSDVAGLVRAGCRSEAAFLGFSANHEAAAMQVAVTCPARQQSQDKLQYAQVFAVATGRIRATFRTAAPERRVGGDLVAVSPASWRALYPALRQALSPAAWQRVANQAQFAAKQHDFADVEVQLRPIDDGLSHAHEQNKAVWLSNEGGRPLHFAVVVQTMAGNREDVLTFSQPVPAAKLRFYFARDGRQVAAIVTAGPADCWLLLSPHPLAAPIDLATKLGAVPVMTWQAEQLHRQFRAILPPSNERNAALAAETFHM